MLQATEASPDAARRWEKGTIIAHGDMGSLKLKSRWCRACTSVGLLQGLVGTGTSMPHHFFVAVPHFFLIFSPLSRLALPMQIGLCLSTGFAVEPSAAAAMLGAIQSMQTCLAARGSSKTKLQSLTQIASVIQLACSSSRRDWPSCQSKSLGSAWQVKDWIRSPIIAPPKRSHAHAVHEAVRQALLSLLILLQQWLPRAQDAEGLARINLSEHAASSLALAHSLMELVPLRPDPIPTSATTPAEYFPHSNWMVCSETRLDSQIWLLLPPPKLSTVQVPAHQFQSKLAVKPCRSHPSLLHGG